MRRIAVVFATAALAAFAQAQELSFPPPKVANYNQIVANADSGVSTFRFARNNRVFVLDFMTLAEQGATFNRISAFIERQRAPRDRILSQDEFGSYLEMLGRKAETLSYGNNFTVGNLVLFFNLADDQGVPLGRHEQALLSLLLEQQLVFKRTGFYQPRDANSVVLSIPRAGRGTMSPFPVTPQMRTSILTHELAHAEYYINSKYAELCRTFWYDSLTDEQRDHFRQFLANASYDTEIEEVVINEWQAYLFHTLDKMAFSGALVGMKDEELQHMRQSFTEKLKAAGIRLEMF